jgi:uncharacterized protein (TIGR02099 family)
MQETPEPSPDLRQAPVAAQSVRVSGAETSGQRASSARPRSTRWVNLLVRLVFWLTLTMTVLFLAAVAATRFWLVPNADDFRPRVVEELSRLTKQRVVIGGFQAGWNGWSPELKMTRLQILDPRGRILLELPEVETTLSWRSLILFEPRLSALTVRAPRLVIRRTTENSLTVAGIDVDLNATGEGDPAMIEWLLRQRFVQIASGEIEWQDEWRKLPPLRLREVNLRLLNEGSYHRVGMTAIPSAEVAAPIDVRAEFHGSDLRKVSQWDGSAFAQVDYANVAVLARYLPLPIEIAKGEGGLRSWFEFTDGRAVSVTTDFVLREARVLLDQPNAVTAVRASAGAAAAAIKTTQANAPVRAARQPLDVSALSGRLTWRESMQNAETKALTHDWTVRDVVVTTLSGERSAPITGDLKLKWLDTSIVSGALRASELNLGIASTIAQSAPLSAENAQHIASAQLRGDVRALELDWQQPIAATAPATAFNVSAELRNVSARLRPTFAVSGVTGRLKTTAQAGSFIANIGDAASGGSATSVASVSAALGAIVGSAPTKADTNSKEKSAQKTAASTIERSPLVLDFGDAFATPMQFDAVKGRLSWTRTASTAAAVTSTSAATSPATVAKPDIWNVQIDNLDVLNADADARITGSWRSDELGPGIAKISGTIKRAQLTSIHKYLPTNFPNGTRTWLREAILSGTGSEATFAINGPLWHFPFDGDKNGVFDLKAKLSALNLDYADGWPRANDIDAQLTLHGSSVDAQVSRASISGVPLGATQVRIADTKAMPSILEIKGTAAGTMTGFLGFVDTSPVAALIGGFAKGAKATGNGKLALSLAIPLDKPDNASRSEPPKIIGDFAFENNRIDFGGDIPVLDAVVGKLSFTGNDAKAKDITATALGGPVTLNVTTEGGRVRAQASGQTDMSKVSERYNYPFLDQMKGSVNWALDTRHVAPPIGVAAASSAAGDNGTLRISGVIAPQRLPFDTVMQVAATPRDATQPIAFSLQRTLLNDTRDVLEIEIPSVFHIALERVQTASADSAQVSPPRIVERAVVDLGAQKTALPVRGYSVRGEVFSINADEAIALIPALTGSSARSVGGVKAETNSADFVNVNIRTDRAIVFSHVLTDVSMRAQPTGQRWRLALRSKEATGLISVDSAAGSDDIEAVSVRLQKFSWPAPLPETDAKVAEKNAAKAASVSAASKVRWPKLDLIADAFVSEGRDMGRLEVKAQPAADEWRIDSVKLTNPDGSIDANGRWRTSGAGVKAGGDTSVDVAIKWSDSAKFMQRLGLPKGVERAEGSLDGSANWAGSPAQFEYETVGGKFTLKTGAGRFTETDPGIAKLLGVLSLQSLPRRLTFNFDDLFNRGFAFDTIDADVSISNGLAKSDSFNIAGPAARVEIRGSANIALETQNLRVRVFPSVSVATAIGIGLATANPAIGAAAWLGQKLARDPIERILMQEFEVTGSWSAPEVKQNNLPAADLNRTSSER